LITGNKGGTTSCCAQKNRLLKLKKEGKKKIAYSTFPLHGKRGENLRLLVSATLKEGGSAIRRRERGKMPSIFLSGVPKGEASNSVDLKVLTKEEKSTRSAAHKKKGKEKGGDHMFSEVGGGESREAAPIPDHSQKRRTAASASLQKGKKVRRRRLLPPRSFSTRGGRALLPLLSRSEARRGISTNRMGRKGGRRGSLKPGRRRKNVSSSYALTPSHGGKITPYHSRRGERLLSMCLWLGGGRRSRRKKSMTLRHSFAKKEGKKGWCGPDKRGKKGKCFGPPARKKLQHACRNKRKKRVILAGE